MPKVTDAHVEARRGQILHAACRCFARKGLHRTTIRDICEEAGLSTGAVYGYFQSKDEIIEAMAELGRESTRQRLFSADVTSQPAPRALAQILGQLVTMLDSEQAAEGLRLDVRLWGEGLTLPRLQELFQQGVENVVEPFAEIVRRGQQRGEIAPGVDPERAARVFLALGLGLQVQKAMDPTVSLAGCADVTTALVTGAFTDGSAKGGGS